MVNSIDLILFPAGYAIGLFGPIIVAASKDHLSISKAYKLIAACITISTFVLIPEFLDAWRGNSSFLGLFGFWGLMLGWAAVMVYRIRRTPKALAESKTLQPPKAAA